MQQQSARERLAKIIARCGVASRRAAEKLIVEGKVAVNGVTVLRPGTKADPSKDIITVNGTALKPPEPLRYVLLHKPMGTLCTASDPFGREHVVDMVSDVGVRLYPVGRLDRDTTGALILTNDGELAYRLTHPKYKVDKVYRAEVKGRPGRQDVKKLTTGIRLEEGVGRVDEIKILTRSRFCTILELVLHEGRKRQIRRMLEITGFPVVKLHRSAVGEIHLGELPVGKWRFLTEGEVRKLREECWKNKNSATA